MLASSVLLVSCLRLFHASKFPFLVFLTFFFFFFAFDVYDSIISMWAWRGGRGRDDVGTRRRVQIFLQNKKFPKTMPDCESASLCRVPV